MNDLRTHKVFNFDTYECIDGSWFEVGSSTYQEQPEYYIYNKYINEENQTKIRNGIFLSLKNDFFPHFYSGTAGISGPIVCVIEQSYNNTNWYRIYSDGWIEQGGKIGRITVNGQAEITFSKPFITDSYTVVISTIPDDSDYFTNRVLTIDRRRTATSFTVRNNGWHNDYNSVTGLYYACGKWK